jgi:hypothetical protein
LTFPFFGCPEFLTFFLLVSYIHILSVAGHQVKDSNNMNSVYKKGSMIIKEEMPMQPHAFHLNLPIHHIDDKDGLPHITKFAQDKARMIIRLAHSIQLKERLYINDDDASSPEGLKGDEVEDNHIITDEYNLVRF